MRPGHLEPAAQAVVRVDHDIDRSVVRAGRVFVSGGSSLLLLRERAGVAVHAAMVNARRRLRQM